MHTLRAPGDARVGRASAGVAVFVMGEIRPRICGVKTVQWTVFRGERPRTLARAGGRCGRGGVVGRGLGRHREAVWALGYGFYCEPPDRGILVFGRISIIPPRPELSEDLTYPVSCSW